MLYTYTPLTPRYVLKWIVFIFMLNTFFSIYFGSLHKQFPFYYYLAYNQINGMTALTVIGFAMIFLEKVKPVTRLLVTLAAGAIGSLAGVELAFTVLKIGPENHSLFRFTFVFNLMDVSFISGFLYYWEGFADARTRLSNEQNRRLHMEKQVTQTRLNLIQTRIEPRFIFNTLAAVLEVIDTDLPRAKSMQLALIRYLRLSLSKFGTEYHTIGQETEMIRSYLDIYRTRLAEQFDYRIDIPDALNTVCVPSMLVHSLVEKITGHQHAPSRQAKRLTIWGEKQNGLVSFEVTAQGDFTTDNGRMANSLARVGERIENLFGSTGQMVIDRHGPDGLKARITFPATDAYADGRMQLDINNAQYQSL